MHVILQLKKKGFKKTFYVLSFYCVPQFWAMVEEQPAAHDFQFGNMFFVGSA